jgi:hypothetical protein
MYFQAFIDENKAHPDVWAHKLFLKEEKRVMLNYRAHVVRGMAQFGTHLGKAHIQNTGIGGLLRLNATQRHRLGPTQFVGDEDTHLILAGMWNWLHSKGLNWFWVPPSYSFLVQLFSFHTDSIQCYVKIMFFMKIQNP